MTEDSNAVVAKARELLKVEARAVERCADRLGPSFAAAVELILGTRAQGRKLVLTGVGKSHYVAAKLAASFMSTGMTAIFIHPAEAFHGDLGAIQPGDVVVLFSKSGTTAELLSLSPYFRGRNPMLAIIGALDSPIARQADIALDASIEKEACPINMLPTASTTVALAIGDALVAVVAERIGFTRERFAGFHPGGSIGKRLNSRVRDVITPLERVAAGPESLALRAVAQAMSDRPRGAFCVVDRDGRLKGVITDGDLRRAIARGDDLGNEAHSLMNPNPISVQPDMIIEDAIAMLEQPLKRVTCAPVVDEAGRLLGLVHLHDLI
jgi:arabinose-5-phosphate isomerase